MNSFSMPQQEIFDQLKNEFNLQDADIFFLDLIPLIAVIWADGLNQEGELKILYQFVIEHIARVDHLSSGKVISVADANSFLERFAHQKPNQRLLDELMHLFFNKKASAMPHQTILNYCVDIAAACISHYPFGLQERVVKEEKRLLKQLFLELGVSADREIS